MRNPLIPGLFPEWRKACLVHNKVAEMGLDKATGGMDMFDEAKSIIDSSTESDPQARRRHERYPFTVTIEAEEQQSQIESSAAPDPHERRRHARYPSTVTIEAVEA
jgi:hypothetical protein